MPRSLLRTVETFDCFWVALEFHDRREVESITAESSKRSFLPPAFAVAFFAFGTMLIVWYLTLPTGVITGDDLSLVYATLHHVGQSGNPATSIFQTDGARYRPIIQFVFSIIIPLFKTSFTAYVLTNLFVHLVNVFLVALISWHTTRNNLVLTIVASSAFGLSRFSYYYVDQLFGLMEGLALAFLLLAIYDAVEAFRLNDSGRLGRMVLWTFLAAFTHERYLAMIPFVVVCAIFHKGVRSDRRRLATIICGALLIGAVNYSLKTFVFHATFATVGPISFSFNPLKEIGFAWTGFINHLGFNIGPDYLAGQDLKEGTFWAYLVGTFMAVPVAVAVITFIIAGIAGRVPLVLPKTIAFLALYLPLLMTASIGDRQEPRWLLAPYVVLLIAVASIAGEESAAKWSGYRITTTFASSVFMIGAIGSACYYRAFIDNIYFERSFDIGRAVLGVVHDQHPKRLDIATNGDDSISSWTLGNLHFFQLYDLDLDVHYVSRIADVRSSVSKHPEHRILDIKGASITLADTPKDIVYPFIRNYDKGIINLESAAPTPTKRGAFVITWPNKNGVEPSLTVLAGYAFTFAVGRVHANDMLTFSAGKPLDVGGNVRGIVDLEAGGVKRRIFDSELRPAGSTIVWQPFSLALKPYAGKKVKFTFSAATIDGDAVGAWVAFSSPTISRS